MTKKSKKKTRTAKPDASAKVDAPAAAEAVQRLQELAKTLDAASQEAEQIAEVVQTGLANDITDSQIDPAAKKND